MSLVSIVPMLIVCGGGEQNNVPWNLYNDGTLIINGQESSALYNEHNGIRKTGTIDITIAYSSFTPKVPWDDYYICISTGPDFVVLIWGFIVVCKFSLVECL